MKILSVRFKNLNSLVGIWSIDFTHPSYTSDGIFAITGPTGAGKTTILDAICLALYGRTPRLSRVNKSTNELMSRLTGDCQAEVCFETQVGRFRCQWSQHRARNKANGELQTPRHELSHADSGDIIESRQREVVERIEALTGMDYERFTRSMLLAQGGFAVFLQAPSSERAPILEQITGTEIYSRISMKVHERRAEEAKKLEKLKDDAAGIRLLDDEARKELHSNLEAKLILEPQLIEARDTASKSFHWLEDITRLEQDLKNLEERKAVVEQRVELFQPDLQKLDKARRARELEADYAKVSNKREDQTRELDELAVNLEKLPSAEEALRNTTAYHDSAQDALSAAQLKQKQEMLIIKAVREVDINIEHKRKQVEDALKGVQEAEKVFNDTQNSIFDLEISIQESRKQLDDIQQYLDDNAVDSGLIENLAAVKQIFLTLKDTDAQYNEMLGRIASDTGLVQEFEKVRDGIDAKYNEILIQTRDAAEKYRSMAEVIKTLLEDREPEDLYRELDSQKERHNLLEQLQQSQRKMGEARESLRETGVRQDRLKAEQAGLEEESRACDNLQEKLEGEVSHLEIQLDLLKRIQSLEEQRAYLQDGQVCPLCGSLEHPYAQGNIPVLNETESSLKKTKKELKTLVKRSAGLKVKQAEVTKDLEQLSVNEEAFILTMTGEEELCADLLKRLDIEVPDGVLPGVIAGEMEKIGVRIARCSQLISDIEQKRKEEQQAMKDWDTLNKSLEDAGKKFDSCRNDLQIAQNKYDLTHTQCAVLERQYATALDQARLLVEQYGVDDLCIASLDSLLDDLNERRNKWQGKQAEREAQGKFINAGEIELARKQTLHHKVGEELQGKLWDLDNFQSELDQLNLERQDLFADRIPDEEEKRLVEAVQDAEKQQATTNASLRQAHLDLNNLKEKIKTITVSTEARAGDLTQIEQALVARLTLLGFANEADYRASFLNEQEYAALRSTAEDLKNEQLEISALIQDKTEVLRGEREKRITDLSHAELQNNLISYEADIREIQREIGAFKQRLDEEEQARESHEEMMKNIDSQTKELTRWNILHELIGSADGKKYRNFAQGLTFQTMVAYANRQLSKMTDRYLLAADNSELLGLSVIDNYQAGEIRSTKNLSGGESFIVSLALALGLSSMASC